MRLSPISCEPSCSPRIAHTSLHRVQHSCASVLRCKASAAPKTDVEPSGGAFSFGGFEGYILETHQETIQGLEQLDGSGRKFQWDRWQRGPSDANTGYGVTCVLEDGDLIEKGAVNITVVQGMLSPERAAAMSSRGRDVDSSGGQQYGAAAMSLVVHPRSPLVPTLRADVRVFMVGSPKAGGGQAACWYGGGCDLTPCYLQEEDIAGFHSFWSGVCGRHEQQLYPELKAWCDRYFYIPSRKEHRGTGGIFFDDLEQQQRPFDVQKFTEDVGRSIVASWQPIVERRAGLPFTEEQRAWQLLRRGRYIEFNLLYDRGVRFGLDGGRIESIMVSAPPMVAWRYNAEPAEGSEEARLMKVLRSPQEWV